MSGKQGGNGGSRSNSRASMRSQSGSPELALKNDEEVVEIVETVEVRPVFVNYFSVSAVLTIFIAYLVKETNIIVVSHFKSLVHR